MGISKVIFSDEVLIDLTEDTVSAETLKVGVTAHDSTGELITGTLEESGGNPQEEIDRILTSGLTDGYKQFSSDGTIISTTDSQGRTLKKIFSSDLRTCSTTLYDQDDNILGETVKLFYDYPETKVVTTDSQDRKLIKIFEGEDMNPIVSTLYDENGEKIAEMTKTYSEIDDSITSVVEYF